MPGPESRPPAGNEGAGDEAPTRLRIGVLLPSAPPPAWVAAAVEDLRALPVDLRLAVAPSAPARAGRVVSAVERGWRRPAPDPETPRSLTLAVEHGGGGPWGRLGDGDLDLLLALGTPAPHPWPAAPRGVWELRPEPGAAWRATVGDRGGLGVALRRVDAEAEPLRLSFSRVHRLSPARTRARALWCAAALPRRAVADLLAGRHPGTGAATDLSPAGPSPSLVGGALRLTGRAVRTGARRALARNRWFVAAGCDGSGPVPDLGSLRELAAPADRFWADPFAVVDGDVGWIYVEEWPYSLGRGRLAVLEIERGGSWCRTGTVLEGEDHLSHPFVFRWKGETWMLPETSARRTLELWRAVDAPLDWTLESVLMADVELVDATLHDDGERWWLFANLAAAHGSSHEELHLFHAPDPVGPWTPHPANPIVSDPRRARPAGRLFERDGVLWRPAQDCGVRYGGAIVLHRVETLTPAAYAEHPVQRLDPAALRGANRMHTLNTDGWLTVVDGHRDRWRPR